MNGLRDKPAYPEGLAADHVNGVWAGSAHVKGYCAGMTYREAAALHLMAGFATDPGWNEAPATNPAIPAALAVKWADALIAALEAPDAPRPARVLDLPCPRCLAGPGAACIEDGTAQPGFRIHSGRALAFAQAYEPKEAPTP